MLSRKLVVWLLIIGLGAISLISINAASMISVGPNAYSGVMPSLLNNNGVYLPLIWIIAPPTSTQTPTLTPTQTPTPTPTPNTTFTVTTTPSPTLTPSASDHIVISEFRTLGPLGAEDEFIELYNPTGAPVNIGNWLIRKSIGCGTNISTLVTIYYGTILLPGQHYLAAAYASYSSITAADQRFSPGIADNGGLGLVTPGGTVVDQVGMCTGTYYHEGRPLPPLPVAPLSGTPTPVPGTSDQSYERKPGGHTSCYDTGDNFNDFILIAPALPQPQSSGSVLCAGVVLITPTVTPSSTVTSTCTPTPTSSLTPTPTPTPGCVEPPAGLASWWPAEGNAADIQDSNDGTMLDGATFEPGMVGQAFSFSGFSRVSAPTNGLPTGNSDRTLDLWVKVNTFLNGETFFAGYGNFGSAGQSYHLGTAGSTLFFSQWGQAIFGPALQTGRWYHVAVTNAGNAFTLYLDGEVVASGNMPIDTPLGTQLFIGSLPNDSAKRLNGLVDEVDVVSRALSGAEIQAIYSAGHLGKCKPHVLGSPTPTM
jgi:Concanavalin A-like lectin/glucanases superfamily/Lamin Tail Domain